MFQDIFSLYFDASEDTLADKRAIYTTASAYECELWMAESNRHYFFVLVQHPDPSRIEDIDNLIADEFDAEIVGWCVLKNYRKKLGASIIPFKKGSEAYEAITYHLVSAGWLLQVKPRQ